MNHDWDENHPWMQALMLAYNQIRTYEKAEEDHEFFTNLVNILYPKTK